MAAQPGTRPPSLRALRRKHLTKSRAMAQALILLLALRSTKFSKQPISPQRGRILRHRPAQAGIQWLTATANSLLGVQSFIDSQRILAPTGLASVERWRQLE